MKPKFFIVTITFLASIACINAQQNITQDNTTDNVSFNTNATPFDEKKTEGLREEYNKFGQQQRKIEVKHATYNHYNAKGHQHSIIGTQENVVNRPQQATLNNNQYNYNQNRSRKIDNTNEVRVNYNTPITMELHRRPLTSSADEMTIKTGDRQNIVFDKETGQVDDSTLPTDPYEQPLGDAIPFVVALATLYIFIIRHKQ